MVEGLNSIFPKKIYRWPEDTWKDAQHHWSSENSKPQWCITSHLSEWPSSKCLQTSVGKNVEKREPLCTACRTINWCSHCGNQYWASYKIKSRTVIWSSNFTFEDLLKDNKNTDSKDMWKLMLMVALFTIVMQPCCPLIYEWIKHIFLHIGILFTQRYWNLAISVNISGPRRYYVKWNVRQRKTNIAYSRLYWKSKKQKKQTKQN